MSSRTRSRNAFETQLDGGITNVTTSFSVDSSAGLTHPCYVVIDPDSPTKREFIRVDNISGTTWSSVTRGLDGSAAGAQAHATGTPVRAVPVHQHLNDIFTDIEALEVDQHTQQHALDGADHTVSGLTVGHVMRATSATTFAFQALAHTDLGTVGADDHHNQAHAIDGADHTASGLTVGHVLRASGAAAFAFAQLQHGDLGGIGVDDHHAQDHQARHQSGGADALTGLLDATARVGVSKNSGADVGARRTINFIEGTDITITVADDAAGEEIDVTISGSGAGASDHGGLTGLTDDDHTIYAKADGTRAFTGKVTISAGGLEVTGGVASNDGIFRRGVLTGNDYLEIDEAGNFARFVLDNIEFFRTGVSGSDSRLQGAQGGAMRTFFPQPYIAADADNSTTDITNINSAGQLAREITVACEYANQPILVQVTIDCVWVNVPDGEQVLIRPYINQTLEGGQAYFETGVGTSDTHDHGFDGAHDHLGAVNIDGSHDHATDNHSHTGGMNAIPLSCTAFVETTADGVGNVDIGFWADTQTGTADITENTISYTVWRRHV